MRKIGSNEVQIALYGIVILAGGFALNWWVSLLVGAYIGWSETRLSKAFQIAFFSCFVAWLLLSLGFDAAQGFRISIRIGGLIKMPFPLIANLLASTIGGVAAGFSAATTNQLRKTLSVVRG